ncbi:unnamed protein product (macronuclear) [Paramecium tetraurelia]|uniref:Transmembrane protein n=1 Tax=Paramecium tetraurelia TaxID=5888 RepID=A0EH99_PARTE|nr:uncharacterized protein GSPATT00027014001 [Paramecium tetraurelia]CAK94690.1 unnamed protein product [Paramecium tetraurelia]|eukprot:XP_001462063.1 hypothetical protein (macronuclear) [Paramecium tetraurelia strain d4-2]
MSFQINQMNVELVSNKQFQMGIIISVNSLKILFSQYSKLLSEFIAFSYALISIHINKFRIQSNEKLLLIIQYNWNCFVQNNFLCILNLNLILQNNKKLFRQRELSMNLKLQKQQFQQRYKNCQDYKLILIFPDQLQK